MVTFQTPQFIETQAKIVGPLTLVQFFYVAAGAGLSFIAFMIFQFFLALLLTIIFGGAGLVLAFVKINGQVLPKVLLAGLRHAWRPKTYTWQRIIPEKTFEIPEENIMNIINARQNLSFQEKLKIAAQKIITTPWRGAYKIAQDRNAKHYQVIKELTGEREIAKKIDY